MKRYKSKKSGFTLVEMLTVMTIIAVLAGMVALAVMTALGAVNRAVIKTEIGQIEMALAAYKDKFGEYPPDAQNDVGKHMRRCHKNSLVGNDPKNVNPETALVIFLGPRNTDPTKPFTASTQMTAGFMDFDKSRVQNNNYFPRNCTAPYVYFRSESDLYDTKVASPTHKAKPYHDKSGVWYGEKSYQVISAGLDNQFGGTQKVDDNLPKADWDNITSFAPTTIKDLRD